MRLILLSSALGLAACATPSHPLTYVHPGDPVWWSDQQAAAIMPAPAPTISPPSNPLSQGQNPTIAATTATPRPPPLDWRISSPLVVR